MLAVLPTLDELVKAPVMKSGVILLLALITPRFRSWIRFNRLKSRDITLLPPLAAGG